MSIPKKDYLTYLREDPENAFTGTVGIHPGVDFLEEWLKPLGISVLAASKAMGIPQSRLDAITKGQRSITASTAIRLGLYTGMRAEWWLALQADYDLSVALKMEGREALQQVRPVRAPDGPTWDELIDARAAANASSAA